MKLVTEDGPYTKRTERKYTPTPAELHYWYGGTHAGWNPDNSYAPKHSMRITKTIWSKL